MKKLVATGSMIALLLTGSYGFAQMGNSMTGEQKGEMKQMMPMMEMCRPMMKQKMGEGMMMQDMMRMMMGMMDMQEKMMMGMKPEEKKKMMKDMAMMKQKMHKMMDMKMGMMGTEASQPNLKCAGEWLKKAIDLHEVHIKDPRTATEASQMEMMDQMKKAYGCIAETGAEMKAEPPKEPAAGEKKKDVHVH